MLRVPCTVASALLQTAAICPTNQPSIKSKPALPIAKLLSQLGLCAVGAGARGKGGPVREHRRTAEDDRARRQKKRKRKKAEFVAANLSRVWAPSGLMSVLEDP